MLLSVVYESCSFSHSVLYLILILIFISLISNELVLICHLNLKKLLFKSLAHFPAIFFLLIQRSSLYMLATSLFWIHVLQICSHSLWLSFELLLASFPKQMFLSLIKPKLSALFCV